MNYINCIYIAVSHKNIAMFKAQSSTQMQRHKMCNERPWLKKNDNISSTLITSNVKFKNPHRQYVYFEN